MLYPGCVTIAGNVRVAAKMRPLAGSGGNTLFGI